MFLVERKLPYLKSNMATNGLLKLAIKPEIFYSSLLLTLQEKSNVSGRVSSCIEFYKLLYTSPS